MSEFSGQGVDCYIVITHLITDGFIDLPTHWC